MHRIVNMALACVWYFGGVALIVAGHPIAAVVTTIGALVALRWHNGVLDRHDALPDLPAARLLESSLASSKIRRRATRLTSRS